jgi:hypothetical protein
MPSPASVSLVRQLSRNSSPYHDPVARIHWDGLSHDRYWLPPAALSLHAVPAFMALPEDRRRRLSHYEFLNFIEAGLWLEGLFMERITRSMARAGGSRAELKYRLHELREEAGHSLMFLELIERSGLATPARSGPRRGFAEHFGRHAPLDSIGFWLAVLIGEEVPDRLNRYLRRHPEGVCPVILEIATHHVIDEARHIAYARAVLEARLPFAPAWRRRLLRPLLGRVLQQFVDAFYFPRAELYERAGLTPGRHWQRLARTNPVRRSFVDECLNPTLQMLRQHGLALHWQG